MASPLFPARIAQLRDPRQMQPQNLKADICNL
jgi:hypothetical protein